MPPPPATLLLLLSRDTIHPCARAARAVRVGKFAYAAMQGGFSLLFLSEAAFLVQDPFTYAVPGSDALLVGQKLGWAVGMTLAMHTAVTLLGDTRGAVAALCIVLSGLAKMTVLDGIRLPAASLGAAAVTLAICLYDLATATKEKESKD